MGKSVRYEQSILVSCEIPWDDRQRFIDRVFCEQVRYLLRVGFDHLYIFGTAGEGYAVDTPTFRTIAEIFYSETRSAIAQVGAIGLSTANVVERLSIAHEIGFRDFQISLPSWKPLNDRELLTFFVDVCGAFPDARFLHYNLPRAGRLLAADDYRRIADVVPNLAATKNTCTTVASTLSLIRRVPEIQHFLSEAMFPVGCQFGECSILSSFGPLMPKRTRELFDYGRARDLNKLFALYKRYMEVIEDVLRPLADRELIDGAYDKIIVRLAGIAMPLRLLSPYEAFGEAELEKCRSVLRDKYTDWIE